MAYNTFRDIPIKQTEIDGVAIHTAVSGDKLVGTAFENKQVFDAFPELIADHFNDLCDYVSAISPSGEWTPSGDFGLSYTAEEVSYICSVLDCAEEDITLDETEETSEESL